MTIKLNGSTAGSVALDAPASTTGNADIAFKLPVADGSANQLIQTNGSGQLSFATVNTDYYASEETVDLSTVGAGNKTFNFTNDPKKIEVTMYRGRYANSNTWRMRLRVGSSDHNSGYNDISHTAESNNTVNTARSLNQSSWEMVNSGWTGGNNLITGTMNITRIVQGKYTFDAHWIFHYHADSSNNTQYWLNTHGEVDIGSNACSGLKIFTSNSGNFTSGNITVRTITG